MEKNIIYSESKELRDLAGKLKARYPNMIGYVDLDKIFFAFKGGDKMSEFFRYELLGLKSEWVKYTTAENQEDTKVYCLAFAYSFYNKAEDTPLLEWTLLELLYNCDEKMDGKTRKKNVHEHSRILDTLADLGVNYDWRENAELPELLGDETVSFGLESYDAV